MAWIQGTLLTSNRDELQYQDEWKTQLFKLSPRTRNVAPMAAYLLSLPRAEVGAWRHHWGEEPYPDLFGTVLDVYTNWATRAAYTTGGVVDSVLWAGLLEEDAKSLVPGNIVKLYSPTVTVGGKAIGAFVLAIVESVTVGDDTNSCISIRLQQADTNVLLAKADIIWEMVSCAYPEMSPLPEPLGVTINELYNDMEIFMGAYSASGSQLAETSTRFEGTELERNQDAAMIRLHRCLEGAIHENHLGNYPVIGKNRRTMQGLHDVIAAFNGGSNALDFRTLPEMDGLTWDAGGWDAIQTLIERASRKTNAEKKRVWCSSQVLLAVSKLAQANADIQLVSTGKNQGFGVTIKTLTGVNQDWEFWQHPMYSLRPSLQKKCLVIDEPTTANNLRLVPKKGRDIQFVSRGAENTNGITWVDGMKEGFYGEFTLEYDNIESMYTIDGWGCDSLI